MKFEKKTEVILAIAKAYEQNNTNLIDRVESIILPKDIKLNETLKQKLNEIKNNPIEEPELYKQIKELNTFAFKVELFKKVGLDIDDFDVFEVTEFMTEVVNKITDYIDADGMYKTTPKLDKMKLPRTTQLNELAELATKETKEQTDKNEIQNKIYEISELNVDELSDWEKQVVWDIFLAFSKANQEAMLLRQAIDKTPFARYLKN